MNTKNNKLHKKIFLKFISLITTVLPLSLSAAIFTGMNFSGMILISAVLMIYLCKTDTKKIMPVFSAFLILLYVSQTLGTTSAFVTVFIAGIVSAALLFLPEQFRTQSSSVTSGFSLATALTVTVLLTTHYFGIGASGNDVKEMIASYLSLGFHPNWRGVLYGTIVMVIMITFPRKFKNFCSVVKAPFIAVVFTLILNFFLNPSYMITAINEIGTFAQDTFTPQIALNIFGRIPVHSLAVVMIVGAWESVKWGEIKKSFSSPVSIICFAITVISTLYLGYVYGLIISAILYIINNVYHKKLKSNNSNQSA